jgi:hypothetical protein
MFWKRLLDTGPGGETVALYNGGLGLPYASFGGAAATFRQLTQISQPRRRRWAAVPSGFTPPGMS